MRARGSAGVGASAATRRHLRSYPLWFYLIPLAIFTMFLVVPTIASFYFSFTRWDLFTSEWIGLRNYQMFLSEPSLLSSARNTIVFAFVTTTLKVVLGFALALVLTSGIIARGYLRSVIFFPVLVSTIGVGLTFSVLMDPERGIINRALGAIGVDGPGWLTDPSLALLSVAAVDVWRGVGFATVIFIAGIVSIPREYYEAAKIDGATGLQVITQIIIPLAKPATITVIILALTGGLRSFDLIWAMTGGGPGFASDVLASAVYKQYQAGFYGLSTAGSVVLFLLVMVIVLPLNWWLNRGDDDAR